jgi:hypothetical protein
MPLVSLRWEHCKFTANTQEFGVCNDTQRAAGLELAKQLHGGAALRMSPCDLYAYIKGRTLWLLGWVARACLAAARRC